MMCAWQERSKAETAGKQLEAANKKRDATPLTTTAPPPVSIGVGIGAMAGTKRPSVEPSVESAAPVASTFLAAATSASGAPPVPPTATAGAAAATAQKRGRVAARELVFVVFVVSVGCGAA